VHTSAGERRVRPLTLELVEIAARAAASKTSEETVLLDVGELLGITDHFLITSGRNNRQLKAIVDEVLKQVRETAGTLERRIEGTDSGEWILIDFGDFVVHVFSAEAREYYDLERLWADAPRLKFAGELAATGEPR
jgi:ribosome-associated protein